MIEEDLSDSAMTYEVLLSLAQSQQIRHLTPAYPADVQL